MKDEETKEALKWLEDLAKEVGNDCSHIYFTGVVDAPSGENEQEEGEHFDELWIDQSGGPCGDDYYGEIYARRGSIWVRFHYES